MGQILPLTLLYRPNISTTHYCTLFGKLVWDFDKEEVRVPISVQGIITRIHIKLLADGTGTPASPGEGNSYIFTLMKNAGATPISLVITGTDTEGSNRTMLTVEPGDNFYFRIRVSSSPTQRNALITLFFAPTTNTESHLSTAVPTSLSAGHMSLMGRAGGNVDKYRALAALGVTLSDMYVELETAPGLGKSRTFTLRKNGVNTSLAVTISGTDTTGNNTSDSDALSPEDTIDIYHTSSGGPAVTEGAGISVKASGLTDRFILGGGTTSDVEGGTYYTSILGSFDALSSFSSEKIVAATGAMTVTDLFVKLDTAPGGGKSRTITLVKWVDGSPSDTELAVTISDTNTTGNDQGSVDLVDGGSLYLKWTESGTPTVTKAQFGVIAEVSIVPPTVTTNPCTNLLPTSCTANGTIDSVGDGDSCSVRGFCYKEADSGDPNVFDDTVDPDGSLYTDFEHATGDWSQSLTGLTPLTNYRVRAFVVNSTGIAYGDSVNAMGGYPSDASARVSSIRRVYHPGLYRMELAVGDLGFNVDVSEAAIKRVPDEVAEPGAPEELDWWQVTRPSPLPPLPPEKLQEWIDLQEKLGIWIPMEDWPSWATHTTAPEVKPPTLQQATPTAPKPSTLPSVSNEALLDEFDKLMKLGPVRWTQVDKNRLNVIVAELQSRGVTGK